MSVGVFGAFSSYGSERERGNFAGWFESGSTHVQSVVLSCVSKLKQI